MAKARGIVFLPCLHNLEDPNVMSALVAIQQYREGSPISRLFQWDVVICDYSYEGPHLTRASPLAV